ncbi:hypothetical protein HMPREF0063_11056 [Aeromicrobium marinum DSM 15272]|uniref:Lsr2 family protein n=1 Tax=Aeromicrobium marinum DSM 15272 TaxID=585531 RepID=E2S970_9ACTN|nr:Lsr2 family protein [Aeromicrobium marinum]EFQ84340.1 hypothetical protein HMPREF0063_11056 [Aeromicrobium marinum DSM 15272]
MAKKTISAYFSDLSGEEITTAGPTVYFALDGVGYEIDLTESEHTALRDVLAPYTALARRAAGGRRTGSTGAASGPAPKDVRAWAVEQGLDVPSRGRIPASISEAYTAAH